MIQVTPLASTISDNWFYAVEDDGDMLLIDPIDAPVAVGYALSRGPKRVRIFNTHGHPDHIAGNEDVIAALGCDVIASGYPDIMDPEAQQRVRHGDLLTVGQSKWKVLFAPGHTSGHIMLYHPGHLISGDVLFVGGIGNCRFGGDPDVLYETARDVLPLIPENTWYYPGHDYAARNLEFCQLVEPNQDRTAALQERVRLHQGDDPRRAPFLLTLQEERTINPFLRTADPTLQQVLDTTLQEDWRNDEPDTARAAFKALRRARDHF